MLATVVALILVGAGKPGGDWLVIGQLFTDAFCTTAHDRVSGAVVEGCRQVRDPEATLSALRSDARLTATREHSFGEVSVLQFELSDPGWKARKMREDVGPTPGCDIDQWVLHETPSPECTQEVVFIVTAPGRRMRRFTLVACSPEQSEHALGYVRDVSLDKGPKVVEQDPRSHGRPIPPTEIDRLVGMSAAEVNQRYGPPEWVRPLYPDGLRWVYPRGVKNPAVVVEFDRERRVRSANAPCE